MLDDPQIAVLYSVVVAHRPSLSGQALGHDSQCVHTFLLAPGAPKTARGGAGNLWSHVTSPLWHTGGVTKRRAVRLTGGTEIG